MEALYFVKLSDQAVIPERAYNSIGFDLSSAIDYTINPGTRHVVNTDVAVRFPDGFYGRIAPRSGLSVKSNIDIGAGVIDPGYRGNIRVVMINNGNEVFHIRKGDRIAQLICERAALPEVFEIREFPREHENLRGAKGFGSTGIQAGKLEGTETAASNKRAL